MVVYKKHLDIMKLVYMYYKKHIEIMQLGQEIEPHTPDMSTFICAPFDSDDPRRNGTHPDETTALSSRRG